MTKARNVRFYIRGEDALTGATTDVWHRIAISYDGAEPAAERFESHCNETDENGEGWIVVRDGDGKEIRRTSTKGMVL